VGFGEGLAALETSHLATGKGNFPVCEEQLVFSWMTATEGCGVKAQ